MSTYLYQLVADFIVFKLIDSFAKSAIHDATNDSEKRRIWFYESGFLAAVSFPIYLLDHTPYLLWLLTVCTFLFTQLIGQLRLLYWWNLLKTRWDEHLQHQESLQRLQNNSTISVSSMPASPSPAVTNRGVSGINQPYSGHQMVPQQPPVSNYDHLLPNTSAVISQYGHKSMNLSSQQAAYLGPHYSDNHFLPQQKHLLLHSNQSCGSPSVYFPENVTVCSNTITQNTVGTPWPYNMRRRPLRPSVLRSASPFPLVSTSHHDTKTVREISFKDKLLSSFGFTPKSPPGLENDGQNLCFMNCILQCLARSPHLVSQLLMVNIETIPNVNKEEKQFLSEFIKILNKCSAESQTRMSVLDTEPLKVASQMMKCSLLNEHTQQDAAEFLMWLLTTTHNILNKIHLNKVYGESKMNSRPVNQNDSYNELNVENIQKLKVAYKEKIDKLNSFDNEAYAEFAQHLSDLDWYAYKNENSSIIDNLFTGQLLEAYNCSRKGHLSIQPQTFAVLPIPLGESFSETNIYLEDCFTIFSSVEQLSGQVCSRCTKVNPVEHSTPVSSSVMFPLSYTSPCVNIQTLPAFHMAPYISPIVSNKTDDTLIPHSIRTSTPRFYAGACDGMIREKQSIDRRCLLHQLPECLIIQLLRFTFDSKTKIAKKITTPVNITLLGLDLKDIVFNLKSTNKSTVDPTYKYNLYAMCVHLSSCGTSSGHYICYCLDSNGKWYKFDDDNVTEVDMQYELSTRTLNENAYLLFYKKAS